MDKFEINETNKNLSKLLRKIERPSILDKVPYFEAEDEDGRQKPASTQMEKVTFSVTRYPKIEARNMCSNVPNRQIIVTASKNQPFMVYEDEKDCTPRRLVKSENLFYCPVMDITDFGLKGLHLVEATQQPISGTGTDKDPIFTVNKMKRISMESGNKSFSLVDGNSSASESSIAPIASIDQAPSMFHIRLSDDERERRMITDDEKLILRLEETPTIQLFSIRSRAAAAESMEGFRIADNNEHFDIDSKKLKKSNDAVTQTTICSNKVSSVNTNHARPTTANKSTFSTVWDYMDMVKSIRKRVMKKTTVSTLQVTGKVDKVEFEPPEVFIEPVILGSFVLPDPQRFYSIAMIIEHLLTCNNAQQQQEMFKTFHIGDDVESIYTFKHLWSYKTPETKSKYVVSLSWNLYNPNILAVGYTNNSDKFLHSAQSLVYVWNVKNLVHPERECTFHLRIRCVAFSLKHSTILAVAFETGLIKLLDITTREMMVVGQNMSVDCSLQYGLCTIIWVEKDLNTDGIIECLGNGHINKYLDLHLKTKKCIHQSSHVKGRSKCNTAKESLSAVCLQVHPLHRNLYMMGSSSGTVYNCDLHNTQSYLSKFDAHMGPVYSIQYNHVTPVIFLTSGADWCIKIWAENLSVPLIVLTSGMTRITYADWHPHVPTVVTNLNEEYFEVWDISKKVIKPQLKIKCPKKSFFTTFSFSMSGNTICVGDANGNTHVYILDIAITIESPLQYLVTALLEALSADSELKENAIKVIPLLKTHKKDIGKNA